VAPARPSRRRSRRRLARSLATVAVGPPPDFLRWPKRVVPPRPTSKRSPWASRRLW
jgi:hypothetical protein